MDFSGDGVLSWVFRSGRCFVLPNIHSFILTASVSSWQLCNGTSRDTTVEFKKLKRKFALAPGSICSRYFRTKLANWKLIKKFRKTTCMYLTMLRTTMFFFEPKWHSMRPVQKWQISCQIWDPKFEFSDRKFVIFVQGAYYVISARKKSWWYATWSGTCMIFFGIFW